MVARLAKPNSKSNPSRIVTTKYTKYTKLVLVGCFLFVSFVCFVVKSFLLNCSCPPPSTSPPSAPPMSASSPSSSAPPCSPATPPPSPPPPAFFSTPLPPTPPPPPNYPPPPSGQGTPTLYLLGDAADLDVILCPAGGGGLLCGTAVAAKALKPGIKVIGVEPALADDVAQSFRAGKRISIPTPATIADGLRTNCTGEKNFPIIQQYVDDIVTVSEEGIVHAMREVWEKLHIVVEPSAAVAYAAILEGKVPGAGRRIGLILTGGNVDLEAVPWLKP